MSHMVIYRGSDGKPGYHQTDDIHDAVGFVEQMRNEQGVEHARIFRLEEVVFQYKPYFRVELADGGSTVAEVQEGTVAEASADVETKGVASNGNSSVQNGSADKAVAQADAALDDESAAAGSKKGLFGR